MVVAGLLWRFECLAPRGATANGASGVGLRGPNALCEGEELDFDRTVKIAAMFWPPGATNSCSERSERLLFDSFEQLELGVFELVVVEVAALMHALDLLGHRHQLRS